MTKKDDKLSLVIILSFSLIFMSSTITLVHITHAQTNTTSTATGSVIAKNNTGIGNADQLQKSLGNNTAMMQNNSNLGSPNATMLQVVQKEQSTNNTSGALKGMSNITKSATNNASKTTLSNANKSKETSQPIIANISQGGKAIGNKAGQLAQAIVNETGKVFGSITGTLNKSSTSTGK
jgi:hypothetical protein